MRSKPSIANRWRRLGWLTLLGFTLKGLITTSAIALCVMSVAQ